MGCLLFFPTQNFKQYSSQQGFTLMELLTVIALMAIIATVAITSYDGTQEQGRYDVTKFEMNQIRKALIQFRQDSGSIDFPKQGVYDCTDAANGNNTEINPNIDPQLPTEAGTSDAEKIAWCQHPANFWMLFEDPLATGWNPDTKRGWKGPYLQRKDGYLSLSSNTVNIADIATPVWAIADPYTANQSESGVEWSLTADGESLSKAASPYLLFVDLVNSPDIFQARIVAAGEDGEFAVHYDEGSTNDDNCASAVANIVDPVLCLLN